MYIWFSVVVWVGKSSWKLLCFIYSYALSLEAPSFVFMFIFYQNLCETCLAVLKLRNVCQVQDATVRFVIGCTSRLGVATVTYLNIWFVSFQSWDKKTTKIKWVVNHWIIRWLQMIMQTRFINHFCQQKYHSVPDLTMFNASVFPLLWVT